MATTNSLNAPIPFSVTNGGTGVATLTTAYGVLCAGTVATGNVQTISSLGTLGQVLTSGGAGALPTWGAVSGAVTWVDQTSGTVTMAPNTGYSVNNGASLVTATIPATAAFGSVFRVAGFSSGGWVLQANTGQTVHFGASATTSAGSLASVNQYDGVAILCVVANTTFVVLESVGANITIA